MRDPLLVLGCQDPVAQIREIKARDPHRQKVAELFELWWENHSDAPTKASELAEGVKAAIDPQGRGRQFIAKVVEDLAGTRQSGFVLTRQKGEGRKAVATYQLKKAAPQGDDLGRHPPHPPHPPAGAETSAETTSATGKQNGDASGMPQPSTEHTQGMTADGGIEIAAKTMASWKAEGMRGMRGMRSDYGAVLEERAAQGMPVTDFPDIPDFLRRAPDNGNGPPPRLCDHCGQPGATGQWDWRGRPDGITLHSSCEGPWFDSETQWRQ